MALTEKQLKARQQGIGGSDAAAICGLSPFKTPYGVYLEKIGALAPSESVSSAVEWGHRLEGVIADYFAEKHQVVLEAQDTRFHPKHPFMLANIDRWIPDQQAILEIKTASQWSAHQWGEEGTDQMPQSYLLQCCHYAAVYEVKTVFLVVLIGGHQPKEYVYQRNLDLEKRLIEREQRFWQSHVLKQIPPAAQTQADVLRQYPVSVAGKHLKADSDLTRKVIAFRDAQSEMKTLNEQLSRLKLDLQSGMQDHEYLVDEADNLLVSWKNTQPRKKFDTPAFEKAHPDLYHSYVKTVPGPRVFLMK